MTLRRLPPLSTELVPPSAGRVELGLGKTAWLYAVLGSATLVFWYPPRVSELIAALVLLVLTLCAGHSVGLHRGIIHRTYRAPRWLRSSLAYLFVHTGIGGPVSWIRLHHVRDYHQNTADCPRYFGYGQSVFQDFFWNLHLRFVAKDPALYAVPREDEEDPWLVFLERSWPLHVAGLFLLVYAAFGISAAVTCVSVRVAVSVLGHWLIGFLAHKYGYVRYELDGSPEIGRNLLVLGALSFGEGFHNNHHANPGSARMGETWYELDLGYLLLLAFEHVGLVSELRRTGHDPDVRRDNARKVALSWLGAEPMRPAASAPGGAFRRGPRGSSSPSASVRARRARCPAEIRAIPR